MDGLKIIVRKAGFSEIEEVHSLIPEFDWHTKKWFENRCRNKKHLALIALVKGRPAGYVVGFDRHGDGSFYCWMAGVVPRFRRKRVLTKMMNCFVKYCKRNRYKKIKIKTRNSRRAMLFYLVKNGFLFTRIEKKKNMLDNRICLEKNI